MGCVHVFNDCMWPPQELPAGGDARNVLAAVLLLQHRVPHQVCSTLRAARPCPHLYHQSPSQPLCFPLLLVCGCAASAWIYPLCLQAVPEESPAIWQRLQQYAQPPPEVAGEDTQAEPAVDNSAAET